MFTGIVQEIANVVSKTSLLQGVKLGIKATNKFLENVILGDSIAIQGACMTVVNIERDVFYVDISAHSLSLIVDMPINSYVNLEKAVQANTFLGGHIITGHIDYMAIVEEFKPIAESYHLTIRIDNKNLVSPNIGQFMAKKGSVTINGVSLTINDVQDIQHYTFIHCNIIPHTMKYTTLQYLNTNTGSSNKVNLEIDIIARYLHRFSSFKSCNI